MQPAGGASPLTMAAPASVEEPAASVAAPSAVPGLSGMKVEASSTAGGLGAARRMHEKSLIRRAVRLAYCMPP